MICIIPARGGSTRIPGKNIKSFHGLPIIQYSIETAEKSGLFDHIVVSTDSEEIAQIAAKCGATVYMRPDTLGENDVGTQEVARDALMKIQLAKYIPLHRMEYACVIYATAPLLTIEDIFRGLKALRSSRSLKYAYSTDVDGVDIGNFYWGKIGAFMSGEPLHEHYITVPIDRSRAIDINTPADWMVAESMYDQLRGSHGN